MSQPRRGHPVDAARSSPRLEEDIWVIANVRAGLGLAAEHARVVVERRRARGWPSGKAATPTRSRRARGPARPARSAWSRPSGCGSTARPGRPAGRRAAPARCATPAAAYAPMIRRSSARVCPTQVRCAIGVSVVSRAIAAGDPRRCGRGSSRRRRRSPRRTSGAAARARGSPSTAPPRRPRPSAGRTRTRTSGRRRAGCAGRRARHAEVGPDRRRPGALAAPWTPAATCRRRPVHLGLRGAAPAGPVDGVGPAVRQTQPSQETPCLAREDERQRRPQSGAATPRSLDAEDLRTRVQKVLEEFLAARATCSTPSAPTAARWSRTSRPHARGQAAARGVLLLGLARRPAAPDGEAHRPRPRVARAAPGLRAGPRRRHGRLRHPPRAAGRAPPVRGAAPRRRLARRRRTRFGAAAAILLGDLLPGLGRRAASPRAA